MANNLQYPMRIPKAVFPRIAGSSRPFAAGPRTHLKNDCAPRINSGYFKVTRGTCSKLTSKPTSGGIRADGTVDGDGFVTREFGLRPCELCRNFAGSRTVGEVSQINGNKKDSRGNNDAKPLGIQATLVIPPRNRDAY